MNGCTPTSRDSACCAVPVHMRTRSTAGWSVKGYPQRFLPGSPPDPNSGHSAGTDEEGAPPMLDAVRAGLTPRGTAIASTRLPLTAAQLQLFRGEAEDRFLVPFLVKRARTPAAWGTALPRRLGLDVAHRKSLDDHELVESGSTSWTRLAAERGVAVSTLTRRRSEALDWLATARFLLFRNPERWNLSPLLRCRGNEHIRAQLEVEADVQCDVFDQTQRAPFPPHVPVRLKDDDPRRLSDHHKDLLGWAARSLQGRRRLHLTAQAAIGQPSTVDLTPHLDLQPATAMRGSLEEELEQLRLAIQRFEHLAVLRLQQVR